MRGGSQNNAGFLGLGASLELLSELGAENLAATVLENTERACERLETIGAKIVSDRRLDYRDGQQRSGIVAFEAAGTRSAGG